MKPKTKAASSVRIQPTVKTKQQKKAEKKAARTKQTEIDRQYYNPPTPEYKRLRKIWWGLLIGAIVMTAMSVSYTHLSSALREIHHLVKRSEYRETSSQNRA